MQTFASTSRCSSRHGFTRYKLFIDRSLSNLIFSDVNDIQQLLRLIDPNTFGVEYEKYFTGGLLQMKLDEPVKLQLCFILQHLCRYQLQYRIEGIIAFSEEFVARLQAVSEKMKEDLDGKGRMFRIKNDDIMF